MNWLESLSRLRLVDILWKGETEQLGLLNVQVDNKTINVNVRFNTPEEAKAFAEGISKPGVEERARERTREQLSPLSSALGLMSESTVSEILAATTATNTMAEIKKL